MVRSKFLLIPALLALLSTSALARGAPVLVDLSLYGVGNFTDFNAKGTTNTIPFDTSYGGSLGIGVGTQLELRLSRHIGLEIGFQILPRKFQSDETLSAEVTATYFEVPILFRYWMRNWLVFGAGPYVGGLVGTVNQISTNNTTGAQSESNLTANEFGINTIDFGLALSTKATYRWSKELGAFLEVRYHYGLLNVAKRGDDETASASYRGIQFALGFRLYNIAESDVDEKDWEIVPKQKKKKRVKKRKTKKRKKRRSKKDLTF